MSTAYARPKGTGIITHRTQSTNNLFSYVQQRYPEIAEEAKQAFIPCKYPLSLIEKIRDEVYNRFEENPQGEIIRRRHVIYGVAVLMFSRYPIGSIRDNYLHEGVISKLAQVMGHQLPNASNYADEVASWLHTGCYEGFRKCCEKVRDIIISEHSFC